MEQFFNSIASNSGGGGGNSSQGFPVPNQNNPVPGSRSNSACSRSNSINNANSMNNINMNVLAGMLHNQRGVQQQMINMNLGQLGQVPGQQQQVNFMNHNGGFSAPQMTNQPLRRQSDASILSQGSTGMTNHYSNKALLNMLDDDIDYQNQNGQGPRDQNNPPNFLNNINFNNASQEQQNQLLLAMQQRMQHQQQRNIPQQNQIQIHQNQGQMQHNQIQQNLALMQQNLAQMQQNQQSPQPQQIAQRQQQIQEFLQRHGHNLSDHQRSNLQNQLGSPNNGPAPNSGPSNMTSMNSSGGGGGGNGGHQSVGAITNMGVIQQMQVMPGSNSAQGDSSVLSMDDLMVRQREQLRHLQVMLKTQDDPTGPGDGPRGATPNLPDMNQQQQMAQAAMNFRMHSQRQRQSLQMQSQGQAQQKQTLSAVEMFGGTLGHQQNQKQQSPPVQAQQQQQTQLQQLQMQHQAQQQQQQPPQQKVSSAVMEQMMRQRQQQMLMQMDGQQNESQHQHDHQIPQEQITLAQNPSITNSSHGKKSKSPPSSQRSLSPPTSSIHQSKVSSAEAPPAPPAAANNTRVVPVALSPRYTQGHHQGGVSEAALIYTKHALNSIVLSLNSKSAGGRNYTIRDLSTCLGAWDLSVPSNSSAKRHKSDESRANFNDGNADTAFNFYHERLCPILLDAKRPSGSVPFSVEDFGEGAGSQDKGLPPLTGAIALTFGADRKFTGGIGEEGVLTKAIFEFFYEPSVALGEESCDKDRGLNVLVEAEEQMFARVDDSEQSSFVQAALHALSPSLFVDSKYSVDKNVYVPTIWSGNTNRVYQYCLLGNFDDEGKELASKRLCVAIQKKALSECSDGPSKGVCRITLTLSPTSVLAEKKRMANEREGQNLNELSSAIHRKLRQNLRCLRPPKLVSASTFDKTNMLGPGSRRVNLRRPSMTHLIDPSLIVIGMRCKHELLLDAEEVGKVYINGSLVVDCSTSPPDKNNLKANKLSALGTLGRDVLPAHTVFGVDFTFPTCNSAMFFRELPNKTTLVQEYGELLVDALIDAAQFESDVAGKLLGRLITGRIEDLEDDDQEDDDKEGLVQGVKKGEPSHHRCSSKSSFYDDGLNVTPSPRIKFDDVSHPCFESIVLSSALADPVGIGAKALGTKFLMQYGKQCFPCEIGTDEEYRLCKLLGSQKIAKPVPRRVRDILSRGGYLPLDQMATFIWKGSGACWDGDHDCSMHASEAMECAIQLLRKVGCNDVKPNMVRFVGRKQLEDADASMCELRCWYDARSQTYYVNDSLLFVETDEQSCGDNNEEQIVESVQQSTVDDERTGFYGKVDAAEDKIKPSVGKDNAVNNAVGHLATLEQIALAPEEKRAEDASAKVINFLEENDNVVDVPVDFSEEKHDKVISDENSESMIAKEEVVLDNAKEGKDLTGKHVDLMHDEDAPTEDTNLESGDCLEDGIAVSKDGSTHTKEELTLDNAKEEEDLTGEKVDMLSDEEAPMEDTQLESGVSPEGGIAVSKDGSTIIKEELTNENENEYNVTVSIDKNGECDEENNSEINETDSLKNNSNTSISFRSVNRDQNDASEVLSVSSEQTDKIMNSCRDSGNETSNVKRRYRHPREAAFLLGLNIAREHPDISLLEKFVTCHSS
ncbi:hypothetical protein HJC23_009176 [Cyclotella cryptica]|uniref:Uncharacterized protein n=1 Tax=Cyclotella cryptica TaxID=29204 RepID=A0ABD3PQ28_9STRA|eukprot:CCRYP_013786-RA/>CCRYP_013786-RA protein AED:0.03 eAED:0.03 QI:0/-1/0/1/-1/1/1/0/1627